MLLKHDVWRIKNPNVRSFANVDAKLLSKTLAIRIKKILPHIIHNNQSGYVEGRYIGETIRTIYDVMEFTKNKTGSRQCTRAVWYIC